MQTLRYIGVLPLSRCPFDAERPVFMDCLKGQFIAGKKKQIQISCSTVCPYILL